MDCMSVILCCLSCVTCIVSGELKLNYLKKSYIVTATTFQMAVLLLFNSQSCLRYSELLQNTQLGERELQKTVQSLLDVKLVDCQLQVNIIIDMMMTMKMSLWSGVELEEGTPSTYMHPPPLKLSPTDFLLSYLYGSYFL